MYIPATHSVPRIPPQAGLDLINLLIGICFFAFKSSSKPVRSLPTLGCVGSRPRWQDLVTWLVYFNGDGRATSTAATICMDAAPFAITKHNSEDPVLRSTKVSCFILVHHARLGQTAECRCTRLTHEQASKKNRMSLRAGSPTGTWNEHASSGNLVSPPFALKNDHTHPQRKIKQNHTQVCG